MNIIWYAWSRLYAANLPDNRGPPCQTRLLYGGVGVSPLARVGSFLRRAGKSGYYTGDFTIAAPCEVEQADEQLFRARTRFMTMSARERTQRS